MELEETDQPVVKNRYKATHPFVGYLSVEGVKWHRFEALMDGDPIAEIIGSHADAGLMKVVLACLDEDTFSMIDEYWGA